MSEADLLVTGAAELLTCAGDAADLIGSVTGGGIAVKDGLIVAVGDVSQYRAPRTIDASRGVVLPGFVDAHTHVAFAGDRAAEHAARVAGREPPEGATVGILGTTAVTRAATAEDLRRQTAARVRQMLAHGTTTVESKSGYGLDEPTERRLLELNRTLAATTPVTVVSTYLAHAVPPGHTRPGYVEQILRLLPRIAEAGLADCCDVYCDEGYFDLADSRRILEAAAALGLRPKLHLDAYSHTGAARLAAELSALSVDHCNHTTAAELRLLAEAGVGVVYMPCLDYLTGHPHPLDARAVVDSGVELALATDACPGCWTLNMQLVVAMACRSGGISVGHALRAATYGAARALGRQTQVGSLLPGRRADLIVLDVPSHEDIAYRFGVNTVAAVVKDGEVIHDRA
jgi:imidazolonepropionase